MPDASFTYTSYIRATPERIWQALTPEFGEAVGAQTKLTITHTGFETGSAVLAGVTDGWPIVLSSLKSLLETGEALAFS